MRRVDLLLGLGIALAVGGTWFPALLANLRGAFPTWGLVVLAVVWFAVMGFAVRWSLTRPEPDDALSALRQHRVIRRLELAGDGASGVSLTFALARDGDPPGGEVVLRCHGVAGLRLRQPWHLAPEFGGMRCQDRGTSRRDGLRFRLHDAWNQGIEFACRSFEVEPVLPRHG